MDKIKIMALGGLDEEGKDLYCIEINGNIYVVNGGFKYPDKNAPGIDFIIANFSYLEENKDRVKAYIITKSKKNNFGAIPYIYKKVPAPIYCTKLTELYLKEFSEEYQQLNNYVFNIITLPAHVNIAGHFFDMFSTCASVPQTFGFSIRTDSGNIVYSGDFIVEYSNDDYFKLDLNTLGKIAEYPTLLLMSESTNSVKRGYCSPNHRLLPLLNTFFKEANGRIFIAINNDNLYHIDEVFKACVAFHKKICFYDKTSQAIYDLRKFGRNDYFNSRDVVLFDDVLRIKEQDLVILISDEGEKLYEKVSIIANRENEDKKIRLMPTDMFIMACPPTDNNEVISTSTIDELYKAGCLVRYVTRKELAKMHAYEEDLKMLLSLLKPKYYLPIEGYYVNLLANARLAFDMHIGLSHSNIFLFDNGHSLTIDENGCKCDFNPQDKVRVGDVMIDGIGVGDVVNEIINERTRLSEDGVVVLACGVSKSKRAIVAGPDVQMRGFLFLKDKDADNMLKEITKIFVDDIAEWCKSTSNWNTNSIENQICQKLAKLLLRTNNRRPVIKPNVLIID